MQQIQQDAKSRLLALGENQTTFPCLKMQKIPFMGCSKADFLLTKAIHIQTLLLNTKNSILPVCDCLSQKPKPLFVLCSEKKGSPRINNTRWFLIQTKFDLDKCSLIKGNLCQDFSSPDVTSPYTFSFECPDLNIYLFKLLQMRCSDLI